VTTPNDVENAVMELWNSRRGSHRVKFEIMPLGSREKPFRVWKEGGRGREGYGWTAYIPNREIYENRQRMDRLGREGFPKLDCTCRAQFGLGSAYIFLSDEDELLYVGAAGDEGLWSCIQRRHLRGYQITDGAMGCPELRFPRNRWRRMPRAEPIVEGRFYVVCIVNAKEWGVFENPYAPAYSGTKPYKEISLDIEGWIAARFGKPPLNNRPLRSRDEIKLDLPWGCDPRGTDARLCPP
jgi:hypothetical protein